MIRPERLLLVGSVIVDLLLDVPRLPPRGGDVLGGAPAMQAGGGFNVLAAAARLDLPAALVGRVGDGPLGTIIASALADEGIDLVVPRGGGDTGLCVGLVEPDGERTFVTSPGVESELGPRDLAAIHARPLDAVYLSGYDLVYAASGPTIADWLERERPALVVFDPGPLVEDIPAGLLGRIVARATIVTMSAREAALLADSPRDVAIVRDGSRGCSVTAHGDPPLRVAGFPVDAVDTTGAGDTHTGALLACLAGGADLATAAKVANAAAAFSVTRAGSATGPTRLELERFLEARLP